MLSGERGSCLAKLVRGRSIPIAKLSPFRNHLSILCKKDGTRPRLMILSERHPAEFRISV